jgi:LAO/AO transport system kinase
MPLDRFALGRRLSLLANNHPAQGGSEESRSASKPARRIGLTGAPGAGKSTLAGHLALHRTDGRRVGVLAIDPSSPRTGGAILGDRIRMDELAGSSELFIRSIGSRTATDGLSDNLPEMLDTMDEFEFDEVLLETVGVGQAEYAARAQVDTLVLVLLPESGDIVQAMKAGIMEMADIFVVNKADLPGAHKMATDIKRIAAISRRAESGWRAPVVLTSSARPDTIAELSAQIDSHQAWLASSDKRSQLLDERARYRLRRHVERRLARVVAQMDSARLAATMDQQVEWALQACRADPDKPTDR